MSPIAIALDLLLAALMLVALVVGGRLNRRLKALRDGQASFAHSVAELNEAAGRAEAGLASLRAASEEAHDALLARIETARGLIAKLDAANQRAELSPSVSPPPVQREAPQADTKPALGGSRDILADLAALAGRATKAPPAPAFAPPPHASRPSNRQVFDDELFEGDSQPETPTPQPAYSTTTRPGVGFPKGDRR